MKKRILSALMALCLAFSVSSAALAQSTEGAVSAAPAPENTAVSTQTLDDSTPDATPAVTGGEDDATGANDNGEGSETGNGGSQEPEAGSGADNDTVTTGDEQQSDGQQGQIPADGGEGSTGTGTEPGSTDAATGGDENTETGGENTTPAGDGATVPEGEGTSAPESDEQADGQLDDDTAIEQPSAGNSIIVSDESGDVPALLADGIETYANTNPDGTLTYNGYQLFHGEDTASQGITINVFDYDTVIMESNDRQSSPINFVNSSRRPFLFLYDPGSENGSMGGYPRNAYTGGVRSDIVGTELIDGYPQLAGNGNGLTNSNRSLAYLFDPGQEVNGKTTYANANYLFQKDEQGYYYFNSEQNFATLLPKADNEEGNNFWLYPGHSNVWAYNYSNGRRMTNQVPQFMPFNTIASNGREYDQGNGHTGNYHFGMTVEFDFLLPENGKLEDGSDMTFEFEGDDDVWVYIDGHRVLDLGGIHPSQSGTINFATGEVRINNQRIGYVWDLVGMTEEEWNATEYQTHNLKFFYLERGAGGSNCKLKFNMPTIPKNAVAVTKRVTGDVPEQTLTYTMQFVPGGDYANWSNISADEPIKAGASLDNAKTLTAEDATFPVSAGGTVYIYNVPADMPFRVVEQNVQPGVTVSFNGSDQKTTATTEITSIGSDYAAGTRAVTVTNEYPLEPVTPGHRKYVEKNENGSYDLTLNVTGAVDTAQGETQQLDILYVLDVSGSMAYDMEGNDGKWVQDGYSPWDGHYEGIPTEEQRLTIAKNAITTLENELKELAAPSATGQPARLDIYHSMVTFNDSARVPDDCGWQPLSDPLTMPTNAIDGTNYNSAINAAITQMGNRVTGREDAIPVVIFISDGNPDPSTATGINQIKNLHLGADGRFFAIGIGTNIDATHLNDLIKNIPDITNENQKGYTVATDAATLVQKFTELAASILSADVSNVTITDTLSEYAQLTEDATFTLTIDSGSTPVSFKNQKNTFTITEAQEAGGAKGSFWYGTGEDRKTVDFTVTYTPATPANPDTGAEATPASFSLDFDDNEYTLENGWTYSITTQIEPTEAAYNYYRDNDGVYPDKGEATTDAPGVKSENFISEGKDGFFSNADGAKVTYTSADQPGLEAEYNKPVIQVDSSLIKPTSAELTLSKTFAGLTDEDVYYILFGQGSDNANFSFDINFCDTEMKENGEWQDHWMAVDEEGKSDISLEEFTKPGTDETVTTGDHFKVYASKCLTNPDSPEDLAAASNPQMGATLAKDNHGDWVYTQTLTIPTTPEDVATNDESGYRYFYTVYELHGELPGYAKLDPDSAEYTVQLNKQNDGSYEHTWNGLGKFVQAKADYSNVDRTDALVNMTNEDEQNGIANNELARLHITGDTAISFTNHYTDSMSVTKQVTENGGAASAELLYELTENKEYTVTIEPMNRSKLMKNGKGPNWDDKLPDAGITFEFENADNQNMVHTADDVMINDGVITLKLYRGETVTLNNVPAINYTVAEPGTQDDTENYYWAGVSYGEDYSHDKVNNGPRDSQYDSVQNPPPDAASKDNMGADHWNGYNDGEGYGYNDKEATTKDGKVSVDVDLDNPGATSVDVTLTNDYEHFKTVTITKQVGGELGAKDAAFDFTTNVARSSNEKSYANDINSTTVNDDTMSLLDGEESVGNVTVVNSRTEKDAINPIGYQLSHDDVLTIGKLKKGDTITIVEDAANKNGYDTTYAINGAADKKPYSAKITVTLDDTMLAAAGDDNIIPVVVYNDQDIVTPTGLESNHTAPYTLMVTAAGIAGLALIGAIVNRRIRRRREE